MTKGDDKISIEGRSSGWLRPSLVGALAIALAAASSVYHYSTAQQVTPSIDIHDYAARTEAILKTTPLIDGHNDLPFLLRLELHNQIYDNKTFSFRDGKSTCPILSRLYCT